MKVGSGEGGGDGRGVNNKSRAGEERVWFTLVDRFVCYKQTK